MDGQGNIKVNAPKNMTFTVGENLSIQVGKNIQVNAGEEINTTAGSDIKITASNDMELSAYGDLGQKANNQNVFIDEKIDVQATEINEAAAEVNLYSTKENLSMQSGKTIEFNSAEKSNIF